MRFISVERIYRKQDSETEQEYFLREQAVFYLKKLLQQKQLTSVSSLPLLLAACGGGGSSSSVSTTTPTVPTPDFTESPTGTFTARDDSNRTLDESGATTDLTVTGGGGADTITTGSGADMILGGAGTDTISAGAGDDIIVVIGTTTAGQYTDAAITSPAGVGADLSALIALADLNGHATSDISGAESIDGGAGNNTLVIYGIVDLTGVTLTNVTTLYVNSTLTLTAAQISAMTTVKGDGSSQLTITGSNDVANPSQLDLSMVDISDIDSIASDGHVELLVSSGDQLAGLSNILTTANLTITITSSINASDLVDLIASGAIINIAAGATLTIDTPEAAAAFSNARLGGEGTIVVSDAVAAVANSLSEIQIDADVSLVNSGGIGFDITTLGGTRYPNIDPGDGVLPVVSLGDDMAVHEADGTVTVTISLNATYYETVTIDFTAEGYGDGHNETLSFAPGEYSQTITLTWSDNTDYNVTDYLNISLSSSSNSTIGTQLQIITVLDEEAVEPDGSPDILASTSSDASITVGSTFEAQITHEADEDWVSFESQAGHVYLIETVGVDGTGGTMETPQRPWVGYAPGNRTDGPADNQTYFIATGNGTAFINVDGTPGTYALRVTEVDTSEPNGSADIGGDVSSATILVVDTTLDQNISYNGDADMYAVTLTAGVVYYLTVAGVETAVGTLSAPQIGNLMNSSGQEALNISGGGVTDANASVGFEVRESGTYYIPISGNGGEGTYQISLTTPSWSEIDGSAEIGSTIDTARTITDGAVVEAIIGHVGDQDMFEITMLGGEVWDLSMIGQTDGVHSLSDPTIFGVYDSAGVLVQSVNAATLEFIVPSDGSYYIAATAAQEDSNGTYQLTATNRDVTEPDGSADYANDITTSSTLVVGDTADGSFSYSADQDWHGMSLVAGGIYQVTLVTPFGSSPYLSGAFNAEGNAATIFEYAQGFDHETTNSFYLLPSESGTYFVNAMSAVGSEVNYTISLSQIDMNEPDGGADYNEGVDGFFDYNSMQAFDLSAELRGTISYENDIDYLTLELTAGQSYTFTMTADDRDGTALSNINIAYIVDDLTHDFVHDPDVGVMGTDTFTFTSNFTGTHIIALNNDGTTAVGDYTLTAVRTGLEESAGIADISAGTDTTATITVGSSVTGGVGLEYDRDWYAVTLEAGQVYQFTLRGEPSGVGTLGDPRIEGLYDSNGVLLPNAYNDDGSGGAESLMLFTATENGTYYIAAGGWDNETGSYELAVSDVSATHTGDLPYGPTNAESFPFVEFVDFTDDLIIDALIAGSHYGGDDGSDFTTITYSVPEVNTYYSERDGFGYGDSTTSVTEPWVEFASLTTTQESWFDNAVAAVEAFTNIDFVEVSDSLGSAGQIRIAWTGSDITSAGAWAYLPNPVFSSPYNGDIWLSLDGIDLSFRSDENYITYVMMHELGHALGLDHPFDGNFVMPLEFDNHNWTVMAYDFTYATNDDWDADLYPQTFMYLDILALGYLYGFSETNHDDTTYTYDGSQRYYLTIWDTGGEDTIEVINQSGGVTIDLRADAWSDVGTTISYFNQNFNVVATDDYTIYIPTETVIENAYGAAHDDTIIGNEFDNKLRGGDGDDRLFGNEGDDILDGGAGIDELTGGDGADTFVVRAGDGGAQITDADMVLDFTDGEDLVGLNGLSFSDLTIIDGTGDNAGDTIVQVTSSSEYLLVLDGISASDITSDDFASIEDNWWAA